MAFELVIHDLIVDTLKAVPSLADITYDSVPQKTGYPYVTVGELLANEWDTNTSQGVDASITIHTWSRYRGKKETYELQAAIYEALHRVGFNISGYNVVLCGFVSSQSFLDADGLTRHGVQTFRIVIEVD